MRMMVDGAHAARCAVSDTSRPPCQYTLCLKKVSTFKLSVTLSNLNRFSNFFTARKRMKFGTKPIDINHLTLDMLLQYLGKLIIQIFWRYSADMMMTNETTTAIFLMPRLRVK